MTPADELAGGWAPDKDTVEHANLTRFLTWLADTGRGEFADYHQLWSESVRDVEWFWDAVWHFFGIRAMTLADTVGAWCAFLNLPEARERRAAGVDCGRRRRFIPMVLGAAAARDGGVRKLPAPARGQAGRPGRRLPAEHR